MTNIERKYVAREGTHISQREVEVVGPYLHEKFPDGIYDREKIIADAKLPSSPLHKHFQWDDTEAAHSYRLRQAQQLITCFRIVSQGNELPSVVSIQIVGAPTRVYMETDQAVKQPDLCSQILQDAIRGLESWKRRYSMFATLPELSKVINEIDNVVEKNQTERKTNDKS